MSYFFLNATFSADISNWDTSAVTDMSYVMGYCACTGAEFDPDISSVESLEGAFEQVTIEMDVADWDTSSVTNMHSVFKRSDFTPYEFNVSHWDITSVEDMGEMFSKAWEHDFIGLDLNSWDTSSVVNMYRMFYGGYRVETDVDNWDVSAVTDLGGIFGDTYWDSGDGMDAWDVSNNQNFDEMFGWDYTAVDVNAWDIQSMTSGYKMFKDCDFPTNVDFTNGPSWDVSNNMDFYGFFLNAQFNTIYDLNGWDLSAALDMREFDEHWNGGGLGATDISSWDTSSVTKMGGAFYGSNVDGTVLQFWDVSSVEQFKGLAAYSDFTTLDLSGWDTSSATDLETMFLWAQTFDADVNGWDAGSAIWIYGMFQDTVLFNSDLHWTTSSLTDMTYMFEGADAFNGTFGPDWDTSAVTAISNLFEGTTYTPGVPVDFDFSAVLEAYDIFETATINTDLSSWGMSACSIFQGMFSYTEVLAPDGLGLAQWDLSSAMKMRHMFMDSYNVIESLPWDVSSSTNMEKVFDGTEFNLPFTGSPNITTWNPTSCENFDQFAEDAEWYPNGTYLDDWDMSAGSEINTNKLFAVVTENEWTVPEIMNWDITSTTSLHQWFYETEFINAKMENWAISGPTDMESTFNDIPSGMVRFGDINTWTVDTVNTFEATFYNCLRMTLEVEWDSWDFTSTTNAEEMFRATTLFAPLSLDWDLSGVLSVDQIFYQAKSFNVNISNWDVSSNLDFSYMFYDAESFNQDLNSWDTSAGGKYTGMFEMTDVFAPLELDWNVAAATDMAFMFKQTPLFNGNISNWDVSNVKTFEQFLNDAPSFDIDINSWDTASCTNFDFFMANRPNDPYPYCLDGLVIQEGAPTTWWDPLAACPAPCC